MKIRQLKSTDQKIIKKEPVFANLVYFLFFAFLFSLFFICGAFVNKELKKRGVLTFYFNFEKTEEIISPTTESYSASELWENAGLPVVFLSSLDESNFDLNELIQDNLPLFLKENNSTEVEAISSPFYDESADIHYSKVQIEEGKNIHGFRNFYLELSPELSFVSVAFLRNVENEGLLFQNKEFVYLYTKDGMSISSLTEDFPISLLDEEKFSNGFIIQIDQILDEDLDFDSPDKERLNNLSVVQIGKDAQDLDANIEQISERFQSYQKGALAIDNLFDVEKVGKFYALLDFWNAKSRRNYFYYDIETGLLEPVFADIYLSVANVSEISQVADFTNDWIFSEVLVRESFTKSLFHLTGDNYLLSFKNDIQDEENKYSSIFQIISEKELGNQYSDYWEKLMNRSQTLSLEFAPYQTVNGSFMEFDDDKSGIEINVTNLMMLPIEITAIEVDDITFSIDDKRVLIEDEHPLSHVYDKVVLSPRNELGDFASIPLTIDLSLDDTDIFKSEGNISKVIVVTKILGINVEVKNSLMHREFPQLIESNPLPVQPTLTEVISTHPFLTYSEGENFLSIQPGDWNVEGDLILPDGIGLQILPETTLRFSENSILFSNAPIQIDGTMDKPVHLTAKDQSWGGVAVIKAEELSKWNYVILDKTSGSNEYGDLLGIVRGAWVLTSGVNFYESPLHLKNSAILNTNTEDAINMIHSDFIFDSSEFAFSYADAFDSDFSDGEILNCYFHDIGGDAIDASGSEIQVTDVLIQEVLDKGISAGEESFITVTGADLENVGIGIASKDLSEVSIDEIRIDKASTAALAAYIKKNVYGPAKISATNLVIDNSLTEAIVQTGCEIIVDGKRYQTVELDVKDLYEKGILGN